MTKGKGKPFPFFMAMDGLYISGGQEVRRDEFTGCTGR